jgi:hypothetical protein
MPLRYLGDQFVLLGHSPIRVRCIPHYGQAIEVKAGERVMCEPIQPHHKWLEFNDTLRRPVYARNARSGVCQCEYETFETPESLERDEREKQEARQREMAEAFNRRRNVPRDHEEAALMAYMNREGPIQ